MALAVLATGLAVLMAGAGSVDGKDREASVDEQQSQQATVTLATCQFPVSTDVKVNAGHIQSLMREAAEAGAGLIHFSEAALSGYGEGAFCASDASYWERLRAETHTIMALARELEVWVVLGSSHFVSAEDKPTNCLYVISDQGEIVDRYDKRRLTPGDARTYSPGDHGVTFRLAGVKFGLLICADLGGPQYFEAYKDEAVDVVLQSFYNATFREGTPIDDTVPAQVLVKSIRSGFWIVANNSSAPYSCWPTFIVRPDGMVTERLERHEEGILYHTFPDPRRFSWITLEESAEPKADAAFDQGQPSTHPRAEDRRALP